MNCCADLCEYMFDDSGPTNTTSSDLARLEVKAQTIEEALRNDIGTGNGASYKIKQLFNKHGYNLAIMPGHVKGKPNTEQHAFGYAYYVIGICNEAFEKMYYIPIVFNR